MSNNLIYFLCHPAGDRSKIQVIDLAHTVDYERLDWVQVNDLTYYDKQEAIIAARSIADRYGLAYCTFVSRYNSEDSENAYLY